MDIGQHNRQIAKYLYYHDRSAEAHIQLRGVK